MLEANNDIRQGDIENLKNEGEQIMDNVGPGIFLAVPYMDMRDRIRDSPRGRRFRPE